MEESFWQERWSRNQIGFHQEQVSAYLQRHWPVLAVQPGAKVFVPLCGKSLDMLWLSQQGYRVLAVEFAQAAVEAFFQEHQLSPVIEVRGALTLWRAEGFEIYCGDFFALSASDLAGCSAFYDRAAMIALPVEMRVRYVQHLQAIMPEVCQGLLIALDYEQSARPGPPFAVSNAEVRQCYQAPWQVVELEREDVLGKEWRFVRPNLHALDEVVYQLVRAAQ